MRLYFRPFPGLTLITAIFLAILISLGTWQYHRLQWKTELLTGIDKAANADPFTSLSDVQDALAASEPVDFRRIAFTGSLIEPQSPYLVFTASKSGPAWRPFFAVRNGNETAFVAMTPVPDAERSSEFAQRSFYQINEFAGYVRLYRQPGWLSPKNSPDSNRWFSFNPMPESHNWADSVSGGAITEFYIDDVAGGAQLGVLPVRKPDIPNNHLDYMLTWYSFALILLVIYFMLHYRSGRLGFTSRP